jgi:hypothetical protein
MGVQEQTTKTRSGRRRLLAKRRHLDRVQAARPCVDFHIADVNAHLVAAVGQKAVNGAAAMIPPKGAHTVLTRAGVSG